MPRNPSLTLFPHRARAALACGWVLFAASLIFGNSPANAQTVATTPALSTELPWADLTSGQKTSLKPLEAIWPTLTAAHKRKWVALSQNYPSLSPEGQTKLHERMVDWAALKPKDRELARLNFAESKKLSPSDRAADWEAYQALTPEVRERLATNAKPQASGAAIAIKPLPKDKLVAVPLTRRTPDAKRDIVVNEIPVHPNTLLPKSAPQQ